MMSFWTAIVVIVAIGTLSEVYRARLKANAEKSQEFLKNLEQRMVRIEDRMANLETIVLEREKARQYDKL